MISRIAGEARFLFWGFAGHGSSPCSGCFAARLLARSTGHIGSHTHTTRFTRSLRNSHPHIHTRISTRTAHHASTTTPPTPFLPLQHPLANRSRPRARPQRASFAPPQLHPPAHALGCAHAR